MVRKKWIAREVARGHCAGVVALENAGCDVGDNGGIARRLDDALEFREGEFRRAQRGPGDVGRAQPHYNGVGERKCNRQSGNLKPMRGQDRPRPRQ